MTSLFLKDLRRMVRAWPLWLTQAALCFALMCHIISGFTFSTMLYALCWAAANLVPLALLSGDETYRWYSYCLTLPCTKREYVTGKYLILGIMYTLVTVEVGIVMWFHPDGLSAGLLELLRILTILLQTGAVNLSVYFLLGGKFSVTWFMTLIWAAFCSTFQLAAILQIPLFLVSVLLCVLSWPLSQFWYELRWKKGGGPL